MFAILLAKACANESATCWLVGGVWVAGGVWGCGWVAGGVWGCGLDAGGVVWGWVWGLTPEFHPFALTVEPEAPSGAVYVSL